MSERGLLSDNEILTLCKPVDWPGSPMLHPFTDKKMGSPSYGLEPYGYTVRLGRNYQWQKPGFAVLRPGKDGAVWWEQKNAIDGLIYLRPGEVILAETVESFIMPGDVSGICLGKSTYARLGLHVNATPLEPGWRGVLTIELKNQNTDKALELVVGQGIAQVQFFRGEKPGTVYGGLYQNQTGATTARVDGAYGLSQKM